MDALTDNDQRDKRTNERTDGRTASDKRTETVCLCPLVS